MLSIETYEKTPQQIYSKHENEKKRKYAERILQKEQGTFTPFIDIYNYWRNGTRMSDVSQQTSRINCDQKSR